MSDGRKVRSKSAGKSASKSTSKSKSKSAGKARERVGKAATKAATGMKLARYFTRAGEDPFDNVEWERRTARIGSESGETVFEQADVEIPAAWSQLATNVVVSKYFRGHVGSPEREYSVKQLIGRVVRRMREWGSELGYFASDEDAQIFADELTYLLVNQQVAFNSPVWFNLGVENTPQQASACFINSVDDTMESIMDLAKTEAMLFKGGSGTGSNLSKIRSSREKLKGGGVASGPVSFMKGFDAFAGVIKSGGKTRRAAKMVILDVEHPDILDFIRSKSEEEQKAWTLIEAGYDGGFNVVGGAYDSVFFQNANHSVRVTDDFMRAVEAKGAWETRSVTSGDAVDTYEAEALLQEMAEAAHLCGDPGIQYDTTINRWNTVKNSGRINSSNPCSEYMFLDDTACNLASLNLMTFADDEGSFQVEDFRRAVAVTVTAMEIIVDPADYPTPQIAENSHLYRPLGLGYANLGALLMNSGLPYDSKGGRDLAAAITSLMCGQAYLTSAELAAAMGPFECFPMNREPFLEVIGMHKAAAEVLPSEGVSPALHTASRECWAEALATGERHGYRNGQVTVLAPTGTIAFMMDCDTTGVEPDIALVKYKKLVGGGFLKIVNQSVPTALARLGYSESETAEIIAFVDEHETIEGAPGLAEEHLAVFDCAFRPQNGVRSIDYMGHLRMMGAVQPFLSGAISKTVNLPHDASVENVMEAYSEGWRLGLKALAIYRDGSKRTQPLNAGKGAGKDAVKAIAGNSLGDSEGEEEQDNVVPLRAAPADGAPRRRKLPDERQALTHKFTIAGHEGYLTVGSYDDGQPGEIFLRMAKEGSTISGLMDTIATMTSMALQYGVPLQTLVDKFSHTRFEPSGFTNSREIPIAKSITDYVFRYLGNRFLPLESDESGDGDAVVTDALRGKVAGGSVGRVSESSPPASFVNQADAPSCPDCGSIMIRSGTCYKCPSCGTTSGCS
ncbi:MAG: vitamin B12-dependent ribonucleotide reductase [Deltaproteobacteria bacterium]|nr:vitamin B12-dependent ribonucleotide reductase [Deltaproteobacteria bacterium]